MVDIIKSLPPIPGLSSTNIHRRLNRPSRTQIHLPILVSGVDNIPQNDRTTFFPNNKRWIGRYPSDAFRQHDIFNAPYSMHHEMARGYPRTTVDMSASSKIKQQQQKNSNKESLKVTTITPLPVLSGVDSQNARLFGTLSKHVTIKAEPLRPANYFINNPNKISSSWQKYWASTHTQRRRNESHDLQFISSHSKLDQQTHLATTHFITVHDSSFYTSNENHSHSRKSSIGSSCSILTKVHSSITSYEQSSSIKEKDHCFLIPLVPSSVIHSPRETTPSMNSSKLTEEKPIQRESPIINNDNEINIIATKLYKLPLPSNKPKVHKSTLKRKLRSKSSEKKSTKLSTSSEKKETISLSNTSVSKSKHRTTIKKQQSLSPIITTIARSKYEHIKWDEPYVGVRFDPPTPPCSPSLFIWPEDSDQDEK